MSPWKGTALMRRPLKLAMVGVGVIALTAGGTSIALATTSSHNRVITGCYAKKTGDLRVVGTHAKCHKGEKKITWNQKGQTGYRGARGAKGATGPAGPIGATGPAGVSGPAGTDGRTVLHGSGVPDPSDGTVGDFYINTSANEIYGPKTSSGWGSGTSLVGPAGAAGAGAATTTDSVDTTGFTNGNWAGTTPLDTDGGQIQAFMACAAGNTGWLGVMSPMSNPALNLIGTNGTATEADTTQIRISPPSGSSTLITAQIATSDGTDLTITGSYTYSGAECTVMLQVYSNNP